MNLSGRALRPIRGTQLGGLGQRHHRGRRWSAVLAGAIVVVLGLAQVFLPRIAASRIRDRVGRYGTVVSVSVKAWPAVELMWGSADSVRVRARNLRLSPAQTAKLLWEARGVDSMEMSSASAVEGPLRLSDVSFHKQGRALTAQARITEADARAALPPGFDVRLVKSESGEVEVRASGGLFGVGASVDAVAGASEGRLVARPMGLPGQLTLFADPHVYVEGVGASEIRLPGGPEGVAGYRLTMRASLR